MIGTAATDFPLEPMPPGSLPPGTSPRGTFDGDLFVPTPIDTRPITYEEWLALPETHPPVEVVDGVLVVNPSANTRHAVIVSRLSYRLQDVCPPELVVLGVELDWVLDPGPPLRVRQADVVVITEEQTDLPRLHAPPVLAIEVLSPRGFERDLVAKRGEYAAAGLRDYWVIDPDDPITIVAFELVDGELVEGELVDGELVEGQLVEGQLVERHRATGDETLRAERPFPVEIVPGDLLRRQ